MTCWLATIAPIHPWTMYLLLVCVVSLGLFLARFVAALVSKRSRDLLRRRPGVHLALLAATIGLFFFAISLPPPPFDPDRTLSYSSLDGYRYWQSVTTGYAREIIRKDGRIFYYSPTGPFFFEIPIAEAEAARSPYLEEVVAKHLVNYDLCQSNPLPVLKAVTGHEEPDLEAFRRWWDGAKGTFVFDAEAHLRLRQLWSDPQAIEMRFRNYENLERHQRARILMGDYRLNRPAAKSSPLPLSPKGANISPTPSLPPGSAGQNDKND